MTVLTNNCHKSIHEINIFFFIYLQHNVIQHVAGGPCFISVSSKRSLVYKMLMTPWGIKWCWMYSYGFEFRLCICRYLGLLTFLHLFSSAFDLAFCSSCSPLAAPLPPRGTKTQKKNMDFKPVNVWCDNKVHRHISTSL